jgi:hypothetical protein
MEAVLKYKSNCIKINKANINTWEELTSEIRSVLSIDENKEIDIYILPENDYLKKANFEELFLKRKELVKGFSVEDVVDLEEKIKNLGLVNEFVPDNDEEENNNSFDNTKGIDLDKRKIFPGKCHICKQSFNLCKFGCLLCPNFFLCNKCEEMHPHPMIKYKSNILSDNINKMIQISTSSEKKDFPDIIKKKFGVKKIYPIKLRTNIDSNSFSMGTNQQRMLSLLINNINNITIPKNTLSVLIKNQYDLNINIKDDLLFNDIQARAEIPLNIFIRSNDKNLFDTYNLKIEVMSNNLDIIGESLVLKVVVKNDKEEDELNKQFSEFPSIILLSKEKKKKLQYIINEKLSLKTPREIKAIMEKAKWNIDSAIVDLTN